MANWCQIMKDIDRARQEADEALERDGWHSEEYQEARQKEIALAEDFDAALDDG